jgi:hypothetical protein
MRMRGKSHSRLDYIIVEKPKSAELDGIWIIIRRK